MELLVLGEKAVEIAIAAVNSVEKIANSEGTVVAETDFDQNEHVSPGAVNSKQVLVDPIEDEQAWITVRTRSKNQIRNEVNQVRNGAKSDMASKANGYFSNMEHQRV
ncbi:hypothetical protein RIF29_03347 [Crotalaria pallida]|uniref:Uncharacterized protein n=1 Tax=Crotalaria pallida TaxID=3830 RepID=A0AAN9P990_CROPI